MSQDILDTLKEIRLLEKKQMRKPGNEENDDDSDEIDYSSDLSTLKVIVNKEIKKFMNSKVTKDESSFIFLKNSIDFDDDSVIDFGEKKRSLPPLDSQSFKKTPKMKVSNFNTDRRSNTAREGFKDDISRSYDSNDKTEEKKTNNKNVKKTKQMISKAIIKTKTEKRSNIENTRNSKPLHRPVIDSDESQKPNLQKRSESLVESNSQMAVPKAHISSVGGLAIANKSNSSKKISRKSISLKKNMGSASKTSKMFINRMLKNNAKSPKNSTSDKMAHHFKPDIQLPGKAKK